MGPRPFTGDPNNITDPRICGSQGSRLQNYYYSSVKRALDRLHKAEEGQLNTPIGLLNRRDVCTGRVTPSHSISVCPASSPQWKQCAWAERTARSSNQMAPRAPSFWRLLCVGSERQWSRGVRVSVIYFCVTAHARLSGRNSSRPLSLPTVLRVRISARAGQACLCTGTSGASEGRLRGWSHLRLDTVMSGELMVAVSWGPSCGCGLDTHM